MKFMEKIYFLLSYTNSHDISTRYPNLKSIILMNIFGVIIYFLIPHFLAKAIFTLILIGANYLFKETRGIIISFTPIIIWVLLFSTAKDIPMEWRRPIDVTSLVNMEKKLGSISFKFYKNENTFLDLLAWLPYGIVHYIMPFIVGIYLVFCYKPGYTSAYLFFFGVMNALGVITQLFWPTAPPWYYKNFGTKPASYNEHHGDPAGLQRIDDLFHINFYYTTFTGNPLPWGAWPSLHSGFASYSAIFLTYLFPKYCPLFFLYVCWIWWATMYLGHHYFVDLIGGFVYALVSALGSIAYLMITKPHHKDYNDLKTIVIEGENNIEIATYRRIKSDYTASQTDLLKPMTNLPEEIIEVDQKLYGDSTVVPDKSLITEVTDSSNKESTDVPTDNRSVLSNIDKDSSDEACSSTSHTNSGGNIAN